MPLTVAFLSTVLLGDVLLGDLLHSDVTPKQGKRHVEVAAAGNCPDAAEIARQLGPLLPDWSVSTEQLSDHAVDAPLRSEVASSERSATLRYDEQGTLWIDETVTATIRAEGARDCRDLAQELAVAAALALDPPEPEPEPAPPPPPAVHEPEIHLSLLAAGGVLGSLDPAGPARASGALELRVEWDRIHVAAGAWLAGPGDFELEGSTVALASYAPYLTVGMRWGSRDLRGGIDLGIEIESVRASGSGFDESLSGTAWHTGMRVGAALEWRVTGPLFVAVPLSVSYFPTPVELASALDDVPVALGESPSWLLRGGLGFGVRLR